MSTADTRTRSGKVKDKALRRDALTRTEDNILAYLQGPKALPASNWNLIVLELATNRSIMHDLGNRSCDAATSLELVQRATKRLVEKNRVIRHEDEDGAIMALPNTWPPAELKPFEVTVEDLDPGFDWKALSNTSCRRRDVMYELNHH